jgi:uncharacterized membrane protein YuzA (DUF378 family)
MFWKTLEVIVAILLVIGGILWGLIGFFGFDLVHSVVGSAHYLGRILYALVGFCALYQIFQWKVIVRRWGCQIPRFQHSAAG